jgi:predicted GIY-YIG superfamily endonuclease
VRGTTSLYRFYSGSGELLYIGITNRIPRRLNEHSDEKPWYHEVARITVEHLPDRRTALRAETHAIKNERPKFNIQHNQRVYRTQVQDGSGKWTFRGRTSGHVVRCDLVLYPELDCSAMVDDVYELDGEGQFEAYVQYLQRRHPEWLAADAVPIVWSVHAGWSDIFEAAPFATTSIHGEDFLAHYTWPEDAINGEPLDWYQLPVVNDRFPEFAKALAWTPSPLQAACPLTSILRSRGRA